MIQKHIIVGTLLVLFLSGCAPKAPSLDADTNVGRNNISDATQIAGETVSITENTYGNENFVDGNQTTTGENNHGTNYNSSNDGFQSIYFDFGAYGIDSSMENHISQNTNVMNRTTTARIKIEGNCDEFGTDEYNYALGLKRAKAVKDGIASQGIDTNRMLIISFGESNPVCSNPTEECYSQNRRVDLRFAN